MIRIWQQWEGTASTVANPFHLSSRSAQGHVGSRPFWLKAIVGSRPCWLNAILAQGHQMVVLVVVMAMVALMVIVMNDVGDGDDRSISMVLP
jgi:hypothetical protein